MAVSLVVFGTSVFDLMGSPLSTLESEVDFSSFGGLMLVGPAVEGASVVVVLVVVASEWLLLPTSGAVLDDSTGAASDFFAASSLSSDLSAAAGARLDVSANAPVTDFSSAAACFSSAGLTVVSSGGLSAFVPIE